MKSIGTLVATVAAMVLAVASRADPVAQMTPKAVLSDGGATLTFVYDSQDYGTKGTDWFSVAEAVSQKETLNKPWKTAGANVECVVFDASFGLYKPKNCLKWFYGFAKLVSLAGIENLDVSQATSLKMMFAYCSALKEIDVSQFDTAKVTTMLDMFTGCSKLKTIYASSTFVTTALAKPTELVFSNCSTSLVGGEGTTWSSSYRTAARAKIDGGKGNEGYFTEKSAKVVWNATEKSLTFVFDAKNHGTKLASGATGSGWFSVAEAEALDPNVSPYDVPWCNVKASATEVAVDPTFALYRPKHCAEWFQNCKNAALTSITGLQYLNVSKATNLDAMFAYCANLQELDLSSFNTVNVTNMWRMFAASGTAYTQLKTIYATAKFVTNKLAAAKADSDMFANLKYLTGGNGTAYKSGNVGKAFAHIDAAGAPGYFTAAPVAVLDDAARTLTFYADGANHAGVGKTVYSVLAAEEQDAAFATPPWFFDGSFVTNVVFDASFKAHKPRHCGSWFSGYELLASVEGLENLDVSEATSLASMFYNCCALTELDLSSFDTRNVTSIAFMFGDCSGLKKIYASDRFVTTSLSTPSEIVFSGCSTNLVGGEGTTWNSSMYEAKYAKIDGGMYHEGYFTRAVLPVAVYVSGESALKFYYDNKDHSSEGTVFYVDDAVALGAAGQSVPWHDELNLNMIDKVVFDPSFAGYQPTSCARWFYDFAELTSVSGLQYLDVSKATTFNLMFFNCSKVVTLDLSAFRTPCLTAMFGMFNNCSALERIYATESFSIAQVAAKAGNAFQNCGNLVGGRGSTVAGLGAATVAYARLDREDAPGLFTAAPVAVFDSTTKTLTFYADDSDHSDEGVVYSVLAAEEQDADDCTPPWSDVWASATKVVFDASFKAHKPRHCGSWFDGFSNLVAVDGLGNLDVSEATSLACMFNECSALEELDLSGFDTANVTDMTSMFGNCYALQVIYASKAFSVASVTESDNMFYGCSSLPNYNASRVTKAYANFNASTGYFTAAPVAVFDSTAKTLTFYADGEPHEGSGKTVFPVLAAETLDVETEYAPWYAACKDVVETVDFDSSFADYKPKSLGAWFYGFAKLGEIANLKYLDTSAVTNMAYAFAKCTVLPSLDLLQMDTANVTSMAGMFCYCEGLTTLDLSNFDTAEVTDMSYMFGSCKRLRTIYVSQKFTTAALAGAQDVFAINKALAGGCGTVFSDYHLGSDYARIDGGTAAPGYFTAVPVAVFDGTEETLTFYADGGDHASEGTVYRVLDSILAVEEGGDPLWAAHADEVTEVAFDASFATYRPASCESWFFGFENATAFTGLEYLNVSEAKILSYLFMDCSAVAELDLMSFDTRATEEFDSMFEGCKALETIKASPAFAFDAATSTAGMFANCSTKLAGGNGTAWDSENPADKTYAKIDRPGQAGYFTGAPVDVADTTVITFDPIPDQEHTGFEIEPAVTMKYLGVACAEGIDYTVAYADNIDVGTATATVTGIGNFKGTTMLSFQITPCVATAGAYVSYDLERDLGVVIDADYEAGDKASVKIEGLVKGLALKATQMKKVVSKKKYVVTNVVYTLAGVPSGAVDYETQPMFARVVVTRADKTKVETLQRLQLKIGAIPVATLPDGVLSTAYATSVTGAWPKVTAAWTVKGLPSGLKYTPKLVVTKDKKKKTVTTNALPFTIYGKPTKAGTYTVSATCTYKIGKTKYTETQRATLTVWCRDAERAYRYEDPAYVSLGTSRTLPSAAKVSGLPTGVKFNAKSKILYGTPTKAGVYAVTVTQTDKKKDAFLWKVTRGANDGVLAHLTWSAADATVQAMQGASHTNWTAAIPTGAKVTVSGLPKGLKLVQSKATGLWVFSGAATAAGNYVLTFKTVLNGVTVVERVALKVAANAWKGAWYARQDAGYDKASVLASVSVAAGGAVSLSLTEGASGATVKTSASAKTLDFTESTATLTWLRNKKDPASKRTCVLDFANETVTLDGALVAGLHERTLVTAAKDVTTFVLEEVVGVETNLYAYLSATHDAKKGTFAVAGKLWDGTAVKATTYAIDKATASGGLVLAPFLVTDKAKNAVYLELSDDGSCCRVLESGVKVDGIALTSAGFAASELKIKTVVKKKTKYVSATVLDLSTVALRLRMFAASCGELVTDVDLDATVAANGLTKFSYVDGEGWAWTLETLPVNEPEGLQFRGLATRWRKVKVGKKTVTETMLGRAWTTQE